MVLGVGLGEPADHSIYEDTGATWVLFTGWLAQLRSLAAATAPG